MEEREILGNIAEGTDTGRTGDDPQIPESGALNPETEACGEVEDLDDAPTPGADPDPGDLELLSTEIDNNTRLVVAPQAVNKVVHLSVVKSNLEKASDFCAPGDCMPDDEPPSGRYFVKDGSIWARTKKGGAEELANFVPVIVGELVDKDVDDDKPIRRLSIQVLHAGRTVEFTCTTQEFESLAWINDRVGESAIAFPQYQRGHLAVAARLTSPKWPVREVFSHTGLVKTGSEWRYLSASGALSERGLLTDQAAELPADLHRFALPNPPTGVDRIAAVHAAIELADVGELTATVPVIATVYRAPLEGLRSTTTVVGPTGSLKSSWVAVPQSSMGAGFTYATLPANFDSTANAMMRLLYHAKGAPFVVDEFVPRGTFNDQQRAHREAERLIRAVGNGSGRQRMRRDGKLQDTYYPRGAVILTGEAIPGSRSLVARQFVVNVTKDSINPGRLAEAQENAAKGVVAAAYAAYIQWLLPQVDHIREWMPALRAQLRAEAVGKDSHLRTPETVAELLMGSYFFLSFAREIGALTLEEYDSRTAAWQAALFEVAVQQSEEIAEQDPAVIFQRMISTALHTGRARLLGSDVNFPGQDVTWEGAQLEVKPDVMVRDVVGYEYNGLAALEPDAAIAAAKDMARRSGVEFSSSRREVAQALHAKGWLYAVDHRGGPLRYTKRIRLNGRTRNVLLIEKNVLLSEGDID